MEESILDLSVHFQLEGRLKQTSRLLLDIDLASYQ